MIRFQNPPAKWYSPLLLGGLVVLSALTVPTHPLSAQDFSYTTVTRGEFGGTLGTMMKMVPGATDPTRETTYLKGSLMRTDQGETSTIMDMSEGRFTMLMHEPKTFYSFTLEEMRERMTTALAEAEVAQAEAEVAQAQAAQPPEEEEPAFDIRVSTDRTGRTQDFGGYSAEQFLMVIEMVPRTQEAEEAIQESGSMVLLTELWLSEDFPGYEAFQAAQEEMGKEFLESGGGEEIAAAFQQAFASDPRMQEAFELSMEEMKDLGGMQVKTVTSFVTVPAGMPFDGEAILAAADQPLSEGVGSAMGDAAAEGAKEAARRSVRGLTRGLLGRRKKEEPPEEAQPQPVQTIIMRMTSLLEDVSTAVLSADLFRPAADYTEKAPEWIGG